MKKQHNRQRPNQKKQRQKSTQRVTSAIRRNAWPTAYQFGSSLQMASLALAMGWVGIDRLQERTR
ncbi:hypothetical protein B7L88_gp136 [Rhizobium phage RHEph10]|uniref:hypothetical protein n=1 Tax=Rhizobium phage RHEph10 TaxID=1220717 RepID=UPI0002AAFD45|nr:hypothetical protein B7L88_gp136 [Rhizobium phage RHEph10]AGC36152.1 hypothetical protein RHEph10_gp109 [Rhizobium phage RHEph10]